MVAERTHKVCPKCRENKPLEEFGMRPPTSTGKVYAYSRCKVCSVLIAQESQRKKYATKEEYNAYAAEYRKSDSGKRATIRAKAKLSGLSKDEANRAVEAWDKSDGRCAICKKDPIEKGNLHGLYLDHCHDTLTFRAFLCSQCNTMLGHSHDDPEILLAGAAYLTHHKNLASEISPTGHLSNSTGAPVT